MHRRHLLACLAAGAGAGAAPLMAPALGRAQGAGTIRFIVPFPPGGASDTAGRIVGQAMGQALGRTIVVENRSGAGGLIGGEALARSPADGSVIGLSNISPQGIAPLISANPPYDPVTAFTHIALVAETASVMIVPAASPLRTVEDFLTEARRRQGGRGLSYGSAGVGSPQHLQGELLSKLGQVQLTHVPYRGNAPALQDLLAGQVDAVFSPLAGITGAIAAGQVRVIGVTSAERMPALPDAPTFAEQGLEPITMTSWTGVSGPAGMPEAIVNSYNQAINRAIGSPEVAQRLQTAGLYPPARLLTPAGYSQLIADFPAVWGPVIRAANIPAS